MTKSFLCYKFLSLLPRNYLSFILGRFVRIPLPRFLRVPLLKAFVHAYKIDCSEILAPLDQFNSLGAFFVRELKPGARPVEGDLVSPVDGLLRDCGRVSEGRLPQIKGQDYLVEDFLGDGKWADRFKDGIFFNFYLSPRDYHHVHCPAEAEVRACKYIPGSLWPVNEWSINTIPGVFVKNERLVVYLSTSFGDMALVMVGAMNVGRMEVTFDDIRTNAIFSRYSRCGYEAAYEMPLKLIAGEKLGTFHMGSSVVILLEQSALDLHKLSVEPPQKIRMGNRLLARRN